MLRTRVPKKPTGVAIDLQKLINDEKTADIKLTITDDKGVQHEFFGHKLLLAARSAIFQNMFFGSSTTNTSTLEISDIKDKTVMTQFLQFLYTDTVETINEETIKPLLAVADKYDVPRLKIA